MKSVWALLVAWTWPFHRSWADHRSVTLTCGSCPQLAAVKSSRCSRCAGEQVAGGKVCDAGLSWLCRGCWNLGAWEVQAGGEPLWHCVSLVFVTGTPPYHPLSIQAPHPGSGSSGLETAVSRSEELCCVCNWQPTAFCFPQFFYLFVFPEWISSYAVGCLLIERNGSWKVGELCPLSYHR